ncbi:CBF-domain-containing protein [Rickenella mellea]|uniref:CBF-domain-containing protein n=1 Tax=Rickenella mellea TaxID=50990 RepID=A0A4Y7PPX2_9AGAM|nr:CBF-domain-containing protein [Rickenella mellea]
MRHAKLAKDLKKLVKELRLDVVRPGDNEDEGEDEEEKKEEDHTTAPSHSIDGAQSSLVQTSQPLPKMSSNPNSRLVVEPTAQWYGLPEPLPPINLTSATVTSEALSSFSSRASSLHTSDTLLHNSSNASTSSAADAAFLSRVLSSGTLSDRLSALTLLAQASPVHNTKALESLRSLAQKKGRDESLKALRAVVDWWVGGGAPDRKLKSFRDHPLNHPDVTDRHLILWYFEDWLKKYFFSILQILEALSLDPLPYVRTQAMSLIFTLLKEKPEQEQNLLRLLVNKLGDSEKHVASRASYHILLLLQSHPQMKSIVVREMTSLVLRPIHPTASTALDGSKNLSHDKGGEKEKVEKKNVQQGHLRYYATITFNQIMLSGSPTDKDVAVQLINVYFELFKEILGEGRQDDDEEGGVAEDDSENVAKKKQRRGKGKPLKYGKDKGERKRKAVRGDAGFAELEDNDSKLTSAILTGVNRALPFSKLDVADVSFNAHVDTLFRITHTSSFNISLQALRLLLQICVTLSTSSSAPTSSQPNPIVVRYYRTLYASLQDPRLATSSKQAMYLNLLFKSIKIDTNAGRVKSFVRRFVQLLVSGASGGTEFVAGGLYLLGELFSTVPDLKSTLHQRSTRSDTADASSDNTYDPRKRDPQFANPSASPMWELMPLVHHFHPTVRLHATQLLSTQPLTANADLSLNTLSHFLDRFVYKNPKRPKPRGSSAMQPAAAAQDGTGVRLTKGSQADGAAMLNHETFWTQNLKNISVDQVFFHKYFSQRQEKVKAKGEKVGKRKANKSDEIGEVREESGDATPGDEDDAEISEGEIWNAMKASIPKLGDDNSSVSEDESEDAGSDISSNGSDGQDDMAEESDEDDLIDLESAIPDGLLEYQSSSSQDGDEWEGFGNGAKKRKREGDTGRGKKKLRSLPVFASYDEFEAMIEDGPEDML